jgi:hypothetical protein
VYLALLRQSLPPQSKENDGKSGSSSSSSSASASPDVSRLTVNVESHARHTPLKPDQLRTGLLREDYDCCHAEHCVSQFSPAEIKQLREDYAALDEAGRTDYLVRYIRSHMDSAKNIEYKLLDRHCCVEAFHSLVGVGRGKLYHARALAFDESYHQSGPHGNTGKRSSPKADTSRAWMQLWFPANCDKVSENRWYLPDCFNFNTLYEQFRLENPHLDISKSTFTQEREKHFAKVHVRPPDDFSHCSVCLASAASIQNSTSAAQRRELRLQLNEHLELARLEKVLLEMCKQEADKGQLLLMFVDYSKHVNLPARKLHVDFMSRESGLPFALGGTIGRGAHLGEPERRAWLHLNNIEENSNTVLNLVFWHLRQLRASQSCPNRLVMQFDSCSGQNKNKYMIGLGAWLMHLG